MVGGVEGGGEGAGEEGTGSGDKPATATCGDTFAGSSPATVAARLRLRRRRHLPVTVLVTAGNGMLHETVKI
jgi:hypothetical protein